MTYPGNVPEQCQTVPCSCMQRQAELSSDYSDLRLSGAVRRCSRMTGQTLHRGDFRSRFRASGFGIASETRAAMLLAAPVVMPARADFRASRAGGYEPPSRDATPGSASGPSPERPLDEPG